MGTGHTERLAAGIEGLRESLARHGGDDDLVELLKIIRHPGWTTPAELVFATGIVDVMTRFSDALADMRGVLVQGSRQVGVKVG